MKAYGREVTRDGDGWQYDCECGAHLSGTTKTEHVLRRTIMEHRKRASHERAMANAVGG